jgi:hypothetical protein
MWDAVESLDGCQLHQLLSREHPSAIDRDTLLLTYTLLSRCPEWDASSDVETSITIDDGEPMMALSVAYAFRNAIAGHGTACLVFGGVDRRGFRPVRGNQNSADIFFFSTTSTLPEFWRHLFALENIAERDFFALAAHAFPGLILHPDLSFGRFTGAYRDLRPRVVTILAALCDQFTEEYHRCQGIPRNIQAAMGRYGVELSPESPNTRGSERLMRQRRKDYAGHHFICEWHAKIEPHRNRIHFATPAPEIDGKILIGIFVDHLDT